MKHTFKIGDHLVVNKGLYTHHGIYLGKDKVIHYAGLSNDPSADGSRIQTTFLQNFSQGRKVRIRRHDKALYKGDEVVERAFSRLGENKYNLVFNNCEHFVNWCFEGINFSNQVNNAVLGSATSITASQLARSKLAGKTAQVALASGLGSGLATNTAVIGTSGIMGSVASSAGVGAVAGPLGVAVGAVIGLIGWSIFK